MTGNSGDYVTRAQVEEIVKEMLTKALPDMIKNSINTDFIIFSGNANMPLAEEVCKYLNVSLGKAVVGKFSDGEIRVEMLDRVRRKEVFIIQPTCFPVNDNFMELLAMVDACRRSFGQNITAVIPYFGYARQDKKVIPRVPITASMIAKILETVGVARVIAIDLHANQIQGFFNGPVDHFYGRPIFVQYIKNNFNGNIICVSVDAGGVERTRGFAKMLDADLAIIDKRRPEPNKAKVMNVIGNVKGKICILYDDMVDTAGSLTGAAEALMNNGAKEVWGCAVHAVLSGPAIERIEKSPIKKLIVTNTIPLHEEAKKCDKIIQLSIAELLSKAIIRSHTGGSVEDLF